MVLDIFNGQANLNTANLARLDEEFEVLFARLLVEV